MENIISYRLPDIDFNDNDEDQNEIHNQNETENYPNLPANTRNIKDTIIEDPRDITSIIYHLFFKFRFISFNNTITSTLAMDKFNDKIETFNKIFKSYKPSKTWTEIKENSNINQNINKLPKITDRKRQKKQVGTACGAPVTPTIIPGDENNKNNNKLILIRRLRQTTPQEKWNKKLIPKPSSNSLSNKTLLPQIHVGSTITHKEDNNNNNNNIKQKPKTFFVSGGYPDLISALTERGWVPTSDNTNFEYIFTIKTSDIPYTDLEPHQIIGHFWKNSEITRKLGLLSNWRNWYFKGIDIDNFFPRCYNWTEKFDYEDFWEDYKTNKAICILRNVYESKDKIANVKYSSVIVETAIDIVSRKIDVILGDYNITQRKNGVYLITDDEWNIISEEDNNMYQKQISKLQKRKHWNHFIKPISHNININNEDGDKDGTRRSRSWGSKSKFWNQFKYENNKQSSSSSSSNNVNTEISHYLPIITSLIERLKRDPQKVQYKMNGSKNIWIIKPCGLSRGRGIHCVNSWIDILQYLKSTVQILAQKYIENPWIIWNRKFDIRQWVLVTDWNPLTIWLFETPYLRFGAEDYDIDNFKNKYSHLTNNSIAKHCENFHNKTIPGNMWDIDQFKEFWQNKYGNDKDHWVEIQKKIQKIVILSLHSAKHKIWDRKNSHEVFGYDIMVDEEWNCYWIEVNSSPAWDYSTDITKKLVKEVSEDMLKVVFDYANAKPKERKNVDTGKFKLICKGNKISEELKIVN